MHPPDAPSRKILTYLQVLAYAQIAVKFQSRSSINVRLTEALCIIGFALKGPPKWGFWVILVVGTMIFGGKVHLVQSSSELRVVRHFWSRSDVPCSSIMYGYSHLP